MRGRMRLWLWPIATLAAAFLLYANALSNPFIGDDQDAVQRNPTVAQPSAAGFLALWTSDYWLGVDPSGTPVEMSTDRNLYRPITILSFWLNAVLTGVDASAFRAGNVIAHALAAWLVGLVCWRWGMGIGAFIATALVLVHPIATDVVNRIVGRADALALAGVAGFLATQRAADLRGWTWGRTVTAMLAAVVALGAKESGAIVAPLAFVHAWLGHGNRGGESRWRGALALGLPVTLYLIGHTLAVGAPSYRANLSDLTSNPIWGMSFSERMPAAAALAGHYFALLLWPWPLIAFDVPARLPTWSDPLSWVGAALLLLATLAFVRLLRARHPLALALAWWLASFLIVSQLVIAIGAYSEVRFAYGMLGGLAFGIGWVAMRAAERQTTVVAAGAVAAVVMVAVVVHRNADFVDLQRLLEADVRQRPASPAALIRLAQINDQARDAATAERLLQRVRELAPASAQASYALANFYDRHGRREDARALYEESVAHNPSHYMSLLSLGNMALNQGDLERANALLTRAATVAPDDPFVIYNRAVLDEARGDPAGAIGRLEALVARRPDFTLAVRGLAQLRETHGNSPQRSTR